MWLRVGSNGEPLSKQERTFYRITGVNYVTNCVNHLVSTPTNAHTGFLVVVVKFCLLGINYLYRCTVHFVETFN